MSEWKGKLYLEIPRKHWSNQDTEQRWAEQDRILKLQQVSQEQGAEVNLMNISHLIIEWKDEENREKEGHEKKKKNYDHFKVNLH